MLLDTPSLATRDRFLEACHARGLITRPVWTTMHNLPMYKDCPRMDLSEAEAIRDLIDSQTAASARLAIRQLKGEYSRQLQPIKDRLLDVISERAASGQTGAAWQRATLAAAERRYDRTGRWRRCSSATSSMRLPGGRCTPGRCPADREPPLRASPPI